MTRRTPAEVLSNYAAGLSINDHASPTASEKKPAPPSPVITYRPTFPRVASNSVSSTSSEMTQATTDTNNSISTSAQHFLLADMDGRPVRGNRACTDCITGLDDGQVGQVNWHLDGKECRLCDVAACKPEAFIKPFCDFLTENPTVFHAVDYFKKKLSSAGYKEVSLFLRYEIAFES